MKILNESKQVENHRESIEKEPGKIQDYIRKGLKNHRVKPENLSKTFGKPLKYLWKTFKKMQERYLFTHGSFTKCRLSDHYLYNRDKNIHEMNRYIQDSVTGD